MSAVQMGDGANVRIGRIQHVVEGAIDCGIDREQVFGGQSVGEANARRNAALSFNSDAGVTAVVSPDGGQRQRGVHSRLKLCHGKYSGGLRGGPHNCGNWQCIHEFRQHAGVDGHR